jgi:5-oxoprolinase (ATP-hydrolysing)
VLRSINDRGGTFEFWIDVGGTFTDCFARRPDGSLARLKLLSSGVTKGAVGTGSSRASVSDPARSADPERFFTGYDFRLLDGEGRTVATAKVAQFDRARGELRFAEPLAIEPRAGQPYELTCGEEAPIVAIRHLLGLTLDEQIPPVIVRLGTTRGTNALLTRRGAKTAFVTTRGFGDILRIGYQNRPRLFDLEIRKPAPLFEAVVEIDERITAAGDVLVLPDAAKVRDQLSALKDQGIESLAICLLQAFAHPAHEQLESRARWDSTKSAPAAASPR